MAMLTRFEVVTCFMPRRAPSSPRLAKIACRDIRRSASLGRGGGGVDVVSVFTSDSKAY